MKSPEENVDLPMLNTSSTKGPRMLRGGAPDLPTKVDFRSTENRAARIGVSSVKVRGLVCIHAWSGRVQEPNRLVVNRRADRHLLR
jgi:hypothetical protein